MPHNNGRYPGAYQLNLGGTGGRLTDTPENIFHIAASSWNANPANPTALEGINGWIEQGVTEAHTYNDEFGLFIQYCDLFERVAGTLNGNHRNRTHEAWNPRESDGDLNLSGYTPEQCERFSDFLAWDSRVNGTLLRDMGNSRPESHGCGCHRYGITGYNPYRTVGGEVWSTSSSKICPGTRRVQQLPGIIARAIFIRDNNIGHLPPGRVNLKAALARTGTVTNKPSIDWTDIVATATEAQLAKLLEGAQAAIDIKTAWEQASDGGRRNAFQNLQTTNDAVDAIRTKLGA